LKERLGSRISFFRVFGSKIKGTAELYSDIDIFILLDYIDKQTKEFIFQAAYEANLSFNVVISPIIYEKSTFLRPAIQNSPFIKNVMKEGILR
jgi:predicted nucleotidyltransferase